MHRPRTFFANAGNGRYMADEVECLLDLHEARLELQANELLTEPESTARQGRTFTRIILDEGHDGLPSFRYLAVTGFMPDMIERLGIRHARPSMMALANLLEHPTVRPDPHSRRFRRPGDQSTLHEAGERILGDVVERMKSVAE